MKSRRWVKWVAFAVIACGLAASAQSRKEEITLVLVPREDKPRQLGLDIASRYPTLLVGYRVAPNGSLSLHGWTGTHWVNIAPAAYTAGQFFKTGPSSTLIVEKAGAPVPAALIPPKAWCDEVYKITTTELRPLLHLAGSHFGFSYKDWKWFANRYRFGIDAINPDGINVAWYHKRLDEHLKSDKPRTGADDLQYWVAVRYPVVPEEEPAEKEPAAPTTEPVDVKEDPFTNAVPPAVVMGAGDVPAEEVDDADASKPENQPSTEMQ